MATRNGIITDIQFTGNWEAPSGDLLYCYSVEIDNGDKGTLYLKNNNHKYAVLAPVEYDIVDGKLKNMVILDSKQQNKYEKDRMKANNTHYPKQQYVQQQEKPQKQIYQKDIDYLGFCASYAKDLVVAGKTAKKDIDDFKKVLTEIYNHILSIKNPPTAAEQDKE